MLLPLDHSYLVFNNLKFRFINAVLPHTGLHEVPVETDVIDCKAPLLRLVQSTISSNNW